MNVVLPIEQTDPELAQRLQQIMAGAHVVRGLNASWHTRSYVLQDNTEVVRRTPLPGRNDACPCESGRKFKKCCLPYI